ncbi:MAG: thiamine biosynthesis protein ThiS [Pseudonocardiales bacterium]|nr:thiamine biosynthesis protein ThiS [Pseudonocardiales bacterium]
MMLTVNGEARDAPAGTTVLALVALVAADPRGVAVAVDGEVVPKSTWGAVALRDGQAVEILKAVQGG